MRDWTPAERALLLALHRKLGQLIADPADAVQHYRDSHGFGVNEGFEYRFTTTALQGEWREWLEATWWPDGRVKSWKTGALIASARITYTRLTAWANSLPLEVREQAVVHWRTYPVNSRNLPALAELVLQVLAEPKPAAPATEVVTTPVAAEPTDLLELLEMENV